MINASISASVNISASAFYGDGSNLSNVGGTLTVKEEGVNLTTEATSINFIGAYVTASNSGTDVTVTVNAGAGGTGIGAAEDGSYADGLFSSFTAGTTIGTAVDKFNEVLKILAPSPAMVPRLNCPSALLMRSEVFLPTALEQAGPLLIEMVHTPQLQTVLKES